MSSKNKTVYYKSKLHPEFRPELTRKHFNSAGVLFDECKAATRPDCQCKSFRPDWMSQFSLSHLPLFVLFDSTVTLGRAFIIDTTDQTNCQT